MDEKTQRQGCSYNTALIIGIVGLGFWIIVGISLLSEYPFVLVTALIPLGSLILSWYEQRIGGLLIILSGISPIIIVINIPSLKADDFYGLGVMAIALFITLPLCISGIIITSAKQRKIESKEEEKEQPSQQQKDEKYLEIAKERYAKGEVSKEEFEQLKRDLS